MYSTKRRRTAGAAAGMAALGRLVGTQIRKRARAGAVTRLRSAAPSADSSPLTGQYDYKVDYAKRRLTPRRRRVFKARRKWRAKVVKTVRESNVGSTHLVKRSLATLATANGVSDVIAYGLYGMNGTSNDTFNSTADMREIFREINETDWLSTGSATAGQLHKIYSMHATIEMTVRNVGSTDALIEAYHIRGTRTVQSGTDPTQIYSIAFRKANIAQDPNTGNVFDQKLDFTQVGVTPFQAPLFCRNYRIYKRTKFRIPPGNEVSFMIHDRRPRTIKQELAFFRSTDTNYHGILFQQQGPPALLPSATFAQEAQVTYMAIRRYRIKAFADNLPKTALDISGV